jgi:murein DD-endopeptidase MepM/ murein hydrolase activator NlpD
MKTSAQKYVSFLTLLLLASACTQDQAPIDDRSHQYYGHNPQNMLHDNNYNSSMNTYTPDTNANLDNWHPPKSTAVSPVGVSELPPAGKNGTVAANGSYNNHYDSSPFSTPPSRPLEPSEMGQSASPAQLDSADRVTEKDGISLIWPVTGGKIIAHFKGVMNDGINISLSDGEPIVAAASGTVVYSGNDLKDYGNMIILRHDNSWLTAYANASRIIAKKGMYVKQGDIIAYVGSTGGVKTPQLHFALRKGRTPVDPEKYLPKT